jgi:hypothetical protein
LLAQSLILAADVGYLAQFERESQRVERRPPLFAVNKHVAEKRQAVRLLGAAGGARVRDVSRRGRTLEQ